VADEAVEDLVFDRTRLVDITLRAAWVRHAGAFADDLALVAVGGYGRGELHPSSDIDIMVLLPKSDSADWQPDIERFLTFLWDIGLEVGHSVRSIDDCQRESLADLTVASTLFEARLLAGPNPCSPACAGRSPPIAYGRPRIFSRPRSKNRTERHHRYFDTAYNLEPQRQVESRRPARHSNHRLGGQTPLRHRHARRTRGARLSDSRGVAQAQGRPVVSLEGALRTACPHRAPRR